MAKGVEDTAFYCFNRLVSLNEVGGDPGRFGVSVEEFHRACAETQARWPQTMLATSTHDTKRSEDVRARLALLSEIPERWSAAVGAGRRINEPHRRGDLPDRNAEYLLYQTLVGAWPIAAERAVAYMEKAAREAKAHTSWTEPAPRVRGGAARLRPRRARRPEFRRRLERVRRPAGRARADHVAGADAAQAHRPRRPGHLPGHGAVDAEPRRSRQPPAGRLRAAPPAARRARRRPRPRRSWRAWTRACPSSGSIRQALHLRRRRPEPFGAQRRLPAARRGGRARRTRRGLHARRRSGHDRAAARARPRRRLGRYRASTLPEGRWRNELTGDVVEGRPRQAGAPAPTVPGRVAVQGRAGRVTWPGRAQRTARVQSRR